MDEVTLKRKLADAQAAVVEARKATALRQDAVMTALEFGWSKYRIAAELGVKESIVRSIIATAEKNAAKEGSRGK